MNQRVRQWVLLAAAIGTIAAVWLAPEEGSPMPPGHTNEPNLAPEVSLPAIARAELESGAPNLFASKSWYVAPPPLPVRAGPPPAPTAPPLPFSYLGRLQESQERLTVFLARGEKVYVVHLGDVIDETYQVEALANGQLTLMYLPLKIRQSLNIGNDS